MPKCIYICCPEISVRQYRAFTLTSAPEEDYLSVHIRCHDHFENQIAALLGCTFHQSTVDSQAETSPAIGVDEKITGLSIPNTIRHSLPPIWVDGPFGDSFRGLFDEDVVILVGAGHQAIAFASVLKSIWYRQNFSCESSAIKKAYFFWLCEDINGLEWFKSLLMAIEAQDPGHIIEIHPVSPLLKDHCWRLMLNSINQPSIPQAQPTHFQNRLGILMKTSLMGCNHLRHLVNLLGTPYLERYISFTQRAI